MANEADAAQANVEQSRHRSPNYPGVSLKLAVSKITQWFNQDGVAASPKDAALKHMGYEKLTGDAGRLISALKSFGLVQETEGRIKLTQRGVDIVAYKDGEPKRAAALKAAALSPTIYQELSKEYPGLTVSDTTLKSVLIAEKKFNPKSVDEFTRGLRATLAFAGLSSGAVVESRHEKENGGEIPVLAPEQIPEGDKPPMVPLKLAPPAQPKPLLSQVLVISIPRDFRVDININGDELKREDLNRIRSQFNRWLEGVEEAFD